MNLSSAPGLLTDNELALLLNASMPIPCNGKTKRQAPSPKENDKECVDELGDNTNVVVNDSEQRAAEGEGDVAIGESGRWRAPAANRLALRRLIFSLVGPEGLDTQTVEARKHVRYPASTPVTAIALDDKGKPTGESLRLTLCDISAGGASFASFDEINAESLLVQVVTASLGITSLVGTIAWRERSGRVTRFAMQFATEDSP